MPSDDPPPLSSNLLWPLPFLPSSIRRPLTGRTKTHGYKDGSPKTSANHPLGLSYLPPTHRHAFLRQPNQIRSWRSLLKATILPSSTAILKWSLLVELMVVTQPKKIKSNSRTEQSQTRLSFDASIPPMSPNNSLSLSFACLYFIWQLSLNSICHFVYWSRVDEWVMSLTEVQSTIQSVSRSPLNNPTNTSLNFRFKLREIRDLRKEQRRCS